MSAHSSSEHEDDHESDEVAIAPPSAHEEMNASSGSDSETDDIAAATADLDIAEGSSGETSNAEPSAPSSAAGPRKLEGLDRLYRLCTGIPDADDEKSITPYTSVSELVSWLREAPRDIVGDRERPVLDGLLDSEKNFSGSELIGPGCAWGDARVTLTVTVPGWVQLDGRYAGETRPVFDPDFPPETAPDSVVRKMYSDFWENAKKDYLAVKDSFTDTAPGHTLRYLQRRRQIAADTGTPLAVGVESVLEVKDNQERVVDCVARHLRESFPPETCEEHSLAWKLVTQPISLRHGPPPPQSVEEVLRRVSRRAKLLVVDERTPTNGTGTIPGTLMGTEPPETCIRGGADPRAPESKGVCALTILTQCTRYASDPTFMLKWEEWANRRNVPFDDQDAIQRELESITAARLRKQAKEAVSRDIDMPDLTGIDKVERLEPRLKGILAAQSRATKVAVELLESVWGDEDGPRVTWEVTQEPLVVFMGSRPASSNAGARVRAVRPSE